MLNDSKTIIDYYYGALGSTIRIDVQELEWLKYLRNKIEQLRRRTLDCIDFLQLEDIIVSNVVSFSLATVCKNRHSYIALSFNENKKASIRWNRTIEEIISLLEFIDELIENDKPGHQYLENNYEDLVVELAYKEFSPYSEMLRLNLERLK